MHVHVVYMPLNMFIHVCMCACIEHVPENKMFMHVGLKSLNVLIRMIGIDR